MLNESKFERGYRGYVGVVVWARDGCIERLKHCRQVGNAGTE
jgi:hypothetical protein